MGSPSYIKKIPGIFKIYIKALDYMFQKGNITISKTLEVGYAC